MGLIYLAVYKGKGKLFNWLIRKWTRSVYSHCELLLPDGSWLSASAMDGGVRCKRIDLDLKNWDLYPLPWASSVRVWKTFSQHQGKGYDWPGIFFSQLLATGLHNRRRMFCSEFCADALGLPQPQRYSPDHLAALAKHLHQLTTGQQDEAHAR